MRLFNLIIMLFISLMAIEINPCATSTADSENRPPKIVGLVPARNDAVLLPLCLNGLAQYTDAIVYLDDASDDDSLKIVESLAQECHIETIIRKRSWNRNEPDDRNTLLYAGRAISGTHFIVLDADELFTAPCKTDNFLRSRILALKPGELLMLHWIQLWKGIEQFRFDTAVYKDFAFCDDGKCLYRSGFIHTRRTPVTLTGQQHVVASNAIHGVLHFQAVNWRNYLIKQAWYRRIEHIKRSTKSCSAINESYARTKNETNLKLYKSPKEWFDYNFFEPSIFDKPEQWRETQILFWFATYGKDYFKELDIWDIDWGAQAKK